MNEDRNDVNMADAPSEVDGHKALGVIQVSISDNPSENAYKMILDDGSQVSVPVDQFVAGASVESDVPAAEQAEAPAEEAPAVPETATQEAAPLPQPEGEVRSVNPPEVQ